MWFSFFLNPTFAADPQRYLINFQPFIHMFISGIQQIGVGVSNVKEAFRWYRHHFGMDVPIFEEAATAGLMLP